MCPVVSGSKCQPLDIHATTEIGVQKAFFSKTQIFFAVDSTPRGFEGIFGVSERSGRCPKRVQLKQLNNDSLQRLFPPPEDPHCYSRGPFSFCLGHFFAFPIANRHQPEVSCQNRPLDREDPAIPLNAVGLRTRILSRRLGAGSTQASKTHR